MKTLKTHSYYLTLFLMAGGALFLLLSLVLSSDQGMLFLFGAALAAIGVLDGLFLVIGGLRNASFKKKNLCFSPDTIEIQEVKPSGLRVPGLFSFVIKCLYENDPGDVHTVTSREFVLPKQSRYLQRVDGTLHFRNAPEVRIFVSPRRHLIEAKLTEK